MQIINEALGVYRIDPGELTIKQIRENFACWDEEFRLNRLIIFYDQRVDRVLIGPEARDEHINLCLNALSDLSDRTLEKLNQFSYSFQLPCNRDVAMILMRVVSTRLENTYKNDHEAIPGAKFLSVDGDIFQISKIVSVKSRDEIGRYIIEFYITNKKASIKKVFATRSSRDSEFKRIQKILEMVA